MGDANKSKLCDYGYDFVLATTQRSINATMKLYLNGIDQPTEVVYYARDINNPDKAKRKDPNLITVEELNKRLGPSYPNGIDVFNINDNDTENPQVEALGKAGFKCAFRVKLGIPPHFDDKSAIPDIVTLGKDTKTVGYKMFCKDFDIVSYLSQDGDVYWTNLSQAKNPFPWVFVSTVDMRLQAVDSSFNQAKLPAPVKEAIKNLDDNAFSVQQLFLDLSTAGLQSAPSIDRLDPSSDAYKLLQSFFTGKYWNDMKRAGKPVLTYAVKHKDQTATLAPTDLDFMVTPYLGDSGKQIAAPTQNQQMMATLNYLCMTKNNKFPDSNKSFPWNWVSEGQAGEFDGMISINRNTFANWFLEQIKPSAEKACFVPHVKVTVKPFGGIGCNYETWRTNDVNLTINKPTSGQRILEIGWIDSAYDCAGVDGALGSLRYTNSYEATVDFSGNTITSVVHGIISVRLKIGQTWNEANVVDKTWTTTWTLGVDALGKIVVTGEPVEKNDSKTDKVNVISNFFTDANEVFENLRKSDLDQVPFGPFPFRALVDFVFPGGRNFTFKNLKFSENQDLLAAITYVDPA